MWVQGRFLGKVGGGFGSDPPTMPAAHLWNSAFCLPFVYLARPRCRVEGQWAGRSTAQDECGGGPLSAAPWTQHLRGPVIKSPTGHLRLKGTKEADPLIQSKKVSDTKRAGGVLLTSHFSDQQREGGERGGGSLLTPHRGASSVSKLLSQLLQDGKEEEE